MSGKLSTDIRREQIVRAALEIVAEHGVSGITVKRVAERIGLAPSALYRHYASKADILAAILDTVEERQRTAVTAAMAMDDALAGLKSILMSITGLIRDHRALPLLFPSEEIWHGPVEHRVQLQNAFARFTGSVADLVARAQRDGQVRADIDPWRVVILFFGLYVPPALFSLRMPGSIDFDAQIEFNWELFVRAVAP